MGSDKLVCLVAHIVPLFKAITGNFQSRAGLPNTSKVEIHNLCNNKCDCAFSSQSVGKTNREKRSDKRNVHEIPKGIRLENGFFSGW